MDRNKEYWRGLQYKLIDIAQKEVIPMYKQYLSELMQDYKSRKLVNSSEVNSLIQSFNGDSNDAIVELVNTLQTVRENAVDEYANYLTELNNNAPIGENKNKNIMEKIQLTESELQEVLEKKVFQRICETVIHKEGDKWKIKGNKKGGSHNEKDGDWNASYDSEEDAKKALKGYFYNRK
jgi:hypothetical protein